MKDFYKWLILLMLSMFVFYAEALAEQQVQAIPTVQSLTAEQHQQLQQMRQRLQEMQQQRNKIRREANARRLAREINK